MGKRSLLGLRAASIVCQMLHLEHIVRENVQQNDAGIVQMWTVEIEPRYGSNKDDNQQKAQNEIRNTYNAALPSILWRRSRRGGLEIIACEKYGWKDNKKIIKLIRVNKISNKSNNNMHPYHWLRARLSQTRQEQKDWRVSSWAQAPWIKRLYCGTYIFTNTA